jgi:cysteinyl-tRNA synthetase
VIRFVYLQTHYAKPMDWTAEKASQAEATLRKWRDRTRGVTPGEVHPAVLEALSDDLNTAGAIAELHALAHVHDAPSLLASGRLMGLLTDELGGWEAVGPADGASLSVLDDLSRRLARLREEAMENKDFSAVDALKNLLVEAGVEVRMSKAGVELLPGPGFDSDKLDRIP